MALAYYEDVFVRASQAAVGHLNRLSNLLIDPIVDIKVTSPASILIRARLLTHPRNLSSQSKPVTALRSEQATGAGFTDAVGVFLDGVAFSKPFTVRNDNTLLIQKGTLVDGKSVSDVLLPGNTVLISFRNCDGGIGAFAYTQQ